MKITRKTLLIIIAAMGVLLITYDVLRHFTGFGEGEEWDRYVAGIIIVFVLGLFIYSHKLAKEEKQEKEAEEEFTQRREERKEHEEP